jgi:GNAT superfamily N-acetyltransferase
MTRPLRRYEGRAAALAVKRLAAEDSEDYPMCQRSLYGAWRLVTVYLRDGRILIVAVTPAHRGRGAGRQARQELPRIGGHRASTV